MTNDAWRYLDLQVRREKAWLSVTPSTMATLLPNVDVPEVLAELQAAGLVRKWCHLVDATPAGLTAWKARKAPQEVQP